MGKKGASRSKSRQGVQLSNQAAPKQYRQKLPAGQKAAEPAANAKKQKSPVYQQKGQEEKPRSAQPKKGKKPAASQPMPLPPVVLSSMPPPPVAAASAVEPLVVIPTEDYAALANEQEQK